MIREVEGLDCCSARMVALDGRVWGWRTDARGVGAAGSWAWVVGAVSGSWGGGVGSVSIGKVEGEVWGTPMGRAAGSSRSQVTRADERISAEVRRLEEHSSMALSMVKEGKLGGSDRAVWMASSAVIKGVWVGGWR